MKKIPVSIKKVTKALSAYPKHTLGDVLLEENGVSDLPSTETVLEIVADQQPEVEVVNESYEVTNSEPILTDEEVVAVETFAAESSTPAAPTTNIVMSVLQTLSEQTLQNIKDNLVQNASTICENAEIFFKNRFLKACEIDLSLSSELGIELTVTNTIDPVLLLTGDTEISDNIIGSVYVNSLDFNDVSGAISQEGEAIAVTLDVVSDPSLATGSGILDHTTDVIKALCESLLVAIGSSSLGYEFSVFASGDAIRSQGSETALNYRSSVFSGAIAFNMLSRSEDGRILVKDIVSEFTNLVSSTVACQNELTESLAAIYEATREIDRNSISVDDTTLEMIYGTSDVAIVSKVSGLTVDAESVSDSFTEMVRGELKSLVLEQLDLQALDVEARTVDLVNSVKSVIDSLKPLMSLLPSDLVSARTTLEEAQADATAHVSEIKEIASNSDDLAQEFMLFASDAISYVAGMLNRGSMQNELESIISELFEARVGESIFDTNAHNVGVEVSSEDFILAVEDKVVSALKELTNEIKAEQKALEDAQSKVNASADSFLSFIGNNIFAALPQSAQDALTALKPQLEQVVEGTKRTLSSTAAIVSATSENVQVALEGAKAVRGKTAAKVAQLSGMGVGAKLAVGAVLGAALFFGARKILKK